MQMHQQEIFFVVVIIIVIIVVVIGTGISIIVGVCQNVNSVTENLRWYLLKVYGVVFGCFCDVVSVVGVVVDIAGCLQKLLRI